MSNAGRDENCQVAGKDIRIHCRFIGKSTSLNTPYAPNISRKCSSLTFLVSFSTTIFELLGGGLLLRRIGGLRGLRLALRLLLRVRLRDRE